jgi:hypothetical protein
MIFVSIDTASDIKLSVYLFSNFLVNYTILLYYSGLSLNPDDFYPQLIWIG